MKVVILGESEKVDVEGVIEELEQAGAEVSVVDGIGEDALIQAGIEEADVFLVFDANESVQIPIAQHVKEGIKTVLVTEDAPEYVRGNADLILPPQLAEPQDLVDALVHDED